MNRKSRLLFLTLGMDVLLAFVFFAAFDRFPLPQILPCVHPQAQTVILAVCAALACHLGFGARFLPGSARWALLGAAVLVSLAWWLGSYPYSPLGFSTGRIPLLRGFLVTTRTKARFFLPPGGLFTLASGSPVALEPILLTGEVKCSWASLNGGSLDNPQACDIAYTPPSADYDILRIHLQPACGLPEATAQVKISILP